MKGGRRLRHLEAQQALLHTKDGTSIRGILTAVYSDCVVIANAEYLQAAGAVEAINGYAVIPIENVSWIQTGSSP